MNFWTRKAAIMNGLYGLSIIFLGTTCLMQSIHLNDIRKMVDEQNSLIITMTKIEESRLMGDKSTKDIVKLIPTLMERNRQNEAALKKVNEYTNTLTTQIMDRIKHIEQWVGKLEEKVSVVKAEQKTNESKTKKE